MCLLCHDHIFMRNHLLLSNGLTPVDTHVRIHAHIELADAHGCFSVLSQNVEEELSRVVFILFDVYFAL